MLAIVRRSFVLRGYIYTEFVDEHYDEGPIILQKAVDVQPDDTPQTLQQRVMKESEQVILPEAIRLFAENRIAIEGRVVHIRGEQA